MYMSFQETESAIHLFDKMPQRNEASVGAEISKFSQAGFSREAIVVFRDIGVCRFRPKIKIRRHGIPWSLKSIQSSLMRHEDTSNENSSSRTALDWSTIVPLLKGLHLTELKPTFEVYLPNSKFRKTSPGDPSFVVYLARGHPPSRLEIGELERQCRGIPLKVGHVDHGRVSFFSFDEAELPVLP